MNAERQLKLGFVLFSKEYCAGTLAGIGVGILFDIIRSDLFSSEIEKDFIRVIAFFCIFSGGTWARAIQQKGLQKDKAEKEGGISN
jgi:hypothetical protein